MSWCKRLLSGAAIGASALLVLGCSSGGGLAFLAPGESLVADITPLSNPRLARAQLPDPTQVGPKEPLTFSPAPSPLPSARPILPVSGTQQTSLVTGSSIRVKVRAWVNAKPIFDDEVMQMVAPALRGYAALPEPQRSEKITEAFNQTLDQLIDQEVMHQDAVKKLEKNNPKALDKLKEVVNGEFDKQVGRMREGGVTDEQLKEIEHTARKILERNLISQEYARNRIMPYITSRVSLEEVKEYYETHKNEFQAVDKVQWQDVFIAVGPKHPTVAGAKKFAADLLAKCRGGDDFVKLVEFDDGDSKFRGGDGLGQRRGEIKPAELEPHLFELKEGQIGPIVELATGVHLFRVVKREYAGQIALDDATQKQIHRKLENQVAEREYKRIVRELRSRAVVRIEREAP